MLPHLTALLLLLAAIWYYISPLRQRSARLTEELIQLRNQLIDQQRSIDTMLGQLKDIVVRMDRQGRVLWANSQAERRLSLPTNDSTTSGALHSSQLSMIQLQRDPEWGSRLQQALQRLPERSELPTMQLSDNGSGNLSSFSMQLLPLGDDQALLLCNDITESLQQQQQKDELITNLMHDLKTPLTTLIGYSNT
ncbi:MAG: hypothetical protein Q9M13_09415, partial [Mariprofundales bacterium]|nr:hypothetical protein [Mariprofundales bacterium]